MKENHRMLLVDDDPRWLEMHKDLLFGYRLEILTANDGWEALSLLQSEPIDLVVIDTDIPRLNGVELLKILRKNFPKLPVIMCLSHSDGKLVSAEEVFKVGASAVLQKSEAPTQLLPLVSVLLIMQDLKRAETSKWDDEQ